MAFCFCSASSAQDSGSSKKVDAEEGDAAENLVALVAVVHVDEVDRLDDRKWELGEEGDKGKYSECGLGFLEMGLDSEKVECGCVDGGFGCSAFEVDRPDAISLLMPCTPSLMPSNTTLLG